MSTDLSQPRARPIRCSVRNCKSTSFEQVNSARAYTPIALERKGDRLKIASYQSTRITVDHTVTKVRCTKCHALVNVGPLLSLIPSHFNAGEGSCG